MGKTKLQGKSSGWGPDWEEQEETFWGDQFVEIHLTEH